MFVAAISDMLMTKTGRRIVEKIGSDPRPSFIMSGSLHGAGSIGRTYTIRDWRKDRSKGWEGSWDGTLTLIDFSHLGTAHKVHKRIDDKGYSTFFHEMSHVADELATNGLWPDANQAGMDGDIDTTGVCSAADTTCGSAQATADDITSNLPGGYESNPDKAFKRMGELADHAEAVQRTGELLRKGLCESTGVCQK